MSSASDLQAIALAEFATAGYTGTSIARIAEIAGLSKSSVLYHYASKELLLEAAVTPAIERMAVILDSVAGRPLSRARRRAFIEEFVDFLLQYRLEVHLFINQAKSLEDVPVMVSASQLVGRIAAFFHTSATSTVDHMRFGIALGGAAYLLVSGFELDTDPLPIDETRAALITVMTELLDPISE
ncbi:TetR/AcrR family transcriptional regulator [Homoserinimonas aerilata]|nr:TetR/AcrR family transcriptional regulator [Homoserinimonas aerilata]